MLNLCPCFCSRPEHLNNYKNSEQYKDIYRAIRVNPKRVTYDSIATVHSKEELQPYLSQWMTILIIDTQSRKPQNTFFPRMKITCEQSAKGEDKYYAQYGRGKGLSTPLNPIIQKVEAGVFCIKILLMEK